jgi:anti-anti-sigma regulatory factor
MFEVQVDISKNLVTLSWHGRVDPDEARRCAEELESRLSDVQRGFRLLGDLTNLESMDVACAPWLRKVMDLCNQQGIAMVVRVIPDPKKDIGLAIMSLFHYDRGVRIVTCKSLEQAMVVLSE